MKIPTILGEAIVYKSPRTQVKNIKLQFGNTQPVEWEYPQVPDGVNAVPLLPDNNVVFVREWRPAWKQPILQIPGGNCDSSNEESRILQIRKELQEEIGMDAKKLKKLTSYAIVAGIRKTVHLYLATGLFPFTIQKGKKDEHEYLEVVTMSLGDALELFLSGREFTTSYTLVGLLLTERLIHKKPI